jgi:hypothetical protein
MPGYVCIAQGAAGTYMCIGFMPARDSRVMELLDFESYTAQLLMSLCEVRLK